MLKYFAEESKDATPIVPLKKSQLNQWLKKQPSSAVSWVEQTGFKAKPGDHCLVPDKKGKIECVLVGIGPDAPLWDFASLPAKLPEQTYFLDGKLTKKVATAAALGWALATYRFDRYKKSEKAFPTLIWPGACDRAAVERTAVSTFLIRDLINTPAADMGPEQLARAAETLADEFDASFSVIVGDNLLAQNYPSIHAVGRAAAQAPRLIDIAWGRKKDPKLTLVGKGVCFDSGGLDLKPAAAMRIMKKDMGGAAHVLGLARMIMAAGLPVRLRVLIPAVENSVSGDAMRPLDVITSRSGKTIEIGHTDAEGRVVLSDALTEAISEKPDLIVDCATLTGAARVALGPEIPVLFSNDDALAREAVACGEKEGDPLWQLPLWEGYRRMIDSNVADICNDSSSPYGGAITAGLFLKEFVGDKTPWIHLDLMGWNTASRPGRPEGGEAMGLRALFELVSTRFKGGK